MGFQDKGIWTFLESKHQAPINSNKHWTHKAKFEKPAYKNLDFKNLLC